MRVRRYVQEDSTTVITWFEARGWPSIAAILPAVGWIAEDESGPIAAIWLYVSPPVGFMEWAVTRPKSNRRGLKALELCIEQVKAYTESEGLNALMQFVPNEKLVKYYERRCGFKATEKATLMVWSQKGV